MSRFLSENSVSPKRIMLSVSVCMGGVFAVFLLLAAVLYHNPTLEPYLSQISWVVLGVCGFICGTLFGLLNGTKWATGGLVTAICGLICAGCGLLCGGELLHWGNLAARFFLFLVSGLFGVFLLSVCRRGSRTKATHKNTARFTKRKIHHR